MRGAEGEAAAAIGVTLFNYNKKHFYEFFPRRAHFAIVTRNRHSAKAGRMKDEASKRRGSANGTHVGRPRTHSG